MRAPVFNEPGQPLSIETVHDPEPAAGEVVIKVHRCGVCGTDLHITEGHGFTAPRGAVLGHEFTGEVVALGKGVDRVKIGDRVAALPIGSCGGCDHCLDGQPALCAQFRMLMGGYAEYAIASAMGAIKLPTGLSTADAAIVEPLAVALHGLGMAAIQPGAKILVQGAGPIGLAALFWARRMGAGRVEVIEGLPSRAAIALAMGADSVRAPSAEIPAISRRGDPDAPDVVVECVGRPGMLAQSIALANRLGVIVSLGNCFIDDAFAPASAARKEVRLVFPQLYTRQEFERAVDVLDCGAVEAQAMVTRTVGYSELPGMFDQLRNSPEDCKVLIDPSR